MKITRIAVYQVTLPMEHPYRLSGGRLFEALDSTIVGVDTDAGITGWGEGCPWGVTYLPAFGKGLRAGLEELAPPLLGCDPRRLDVLNATMDALLPGHPYIKSPLDIACWDILGQASGLAVCDLLGGRVDGSVRLHSSIPVGTPAEMLDAIAAKRALGYAIHSCKMGAGIEEDIASIATISEALPGGESATWDVNRGWLCDDAIQIMQATEEFGGHVEEPCATYEECLAVRRRTAQPIILDECIHGYADLVRARGDDAMELIGLKLGRVGGLTKARRIRDFCVATGLRMNIEDTGGSVIADTAGVHLAQSTPASHRRATWFCQDMIGTDIGEGGARNEGGITHAPEAPGLGVTPRAESIGPPVAVYS